MISQKIHVKMKLSIYISTTFATLSSVDDFCNVFLCKIWSKCENILLKFNRLEKFCNCVLSGMVSGQSLVFWAEIIFFRASILKVLVTY